MPPHQTEPVPFLGKVRKIAPEAVVEDNVTYFEVRVELITGQSVLLSGMNVDATFKGESLQAALMAPTVAITSRDNQIGVLSGYAKLITYSSPKPMSTFSTYLTKFIQLS